MLKDFDLTKDHLEGMEHYKTPHTREVDEAARRRNLHRINKNLVALEGQTRGIGAAMLLLAEIRDPEERAFATQLVAECSINSAWYTAARDAKEMRKRLKLPQPVTKISDHRTDGFEMFQIAQTKLAHAKKVGEKLVPALTTFGPHGPAETLGLHLGQAAGGAALYLGCMTLADQVTQDYDLTAEFVSERVRIQSTALLRSARQRADQVGVPPSFGQLAHRDSPLSVWWRNNAPDEAFRALNIAQDQFAITS